MCIFHVAYRCEDTNILSEIRNGKNPVQNIFARGFTNLAVLNRQKTQARCLLPNYGPDIVNCSSHLFGELFSAEYMEVQMFYRLAGVVSAVGDNTVSVFDSCGRGYLRDFFEYICHNGGIIARYFIHRRNVCFRYHENVNGRLRIYIVKGEYSVVLIRFF